MLYYISCHLCGELFLVSCGLRQPATRDLRRAGFREIYLSLIKNSTHPINPSGGTQGPFHLKFRISFAFYQWAVALFHLSGWPFPFVQLSPQRLHLVSRWSLKLNLPLTVHIPWDVQSSPRVGTTIYPISKPETWWSLRFPLPHPTNHQLPA